jgi:hypothetical protein
LDDILIFSKDPTKHDDTVREVLEQLCAYQLYTNLKKCKFGTNMVEFLGFIVGPKGISMDPLQTEAIQNWPTPNSFKDIQIFLGFANFYRRFIQSYSRIVSPMMDLLKGAQNSRQTGPF